MAALKSLVLTGVPGWLTTALLDDLTRCEDPQLDTIRVLAAPAIDSSTLARCQKRWPLIRQIIPYDLAVPHPVERNLEGADTLLHSAGVIHVRHTSDWYRVNTQGTIALAQSAKAAGVRRFVFISSNAAGGASDSFHQLLDEGTPARPRSHYGRSKWLAEQALLQLAVPEQFEVVILRPSMFYGPPVPPRHVEVYRRILHGRMPLVGNGGFARSITYIDNLVQACRLALCHPAASGQIYYIVDARVYTTKEIVEEMGRALGAPVRYWKLPRLVGPVAGALDRALAALGIYWQPLHLVGESHWHVGISCAKAMQELGYEPEVDLAVGMRRAVEWCRESGAL
ncbi:MAG TPA: NAD-dependent epimerase/dehydratase family protein [Bryobacteraceae bacterium]|nr:NAD-dependent epimerase/dehydratase family protein [Bryobacteraceae bacterium]